MKKKTLFLFISLVLASSVLAGCGEPEHVHTWDDKWTTNSKQHWVAATCEHKDLCNYLGDHVDNDLDGYCDECGYEMSDTPTPPTPPTPKPDPGDYYSTISDDMSDDTLVSALKSIISKNVNVSYDWSRYENADEDPNNKNNIITIYARTSLKKSAHVSGSTGWNREHSFPQSKMSGDCTKDNHIIFASDCEVNGTRSNYKLGQLSITPNVTDSYGNATKCMIGSKGGETLFDPGDTIARGMVARATMYAYVLYGLNPTSNFESYDTLLSWHLNYAPESGDYKRNETVFKYQKNRNPFVDHPEYACKIFGTKTAGTRSLCGM